MSTIMMYLLTATVFLIIIGVLLIDIIKTDKKHKKELSQAKYILSKYEERKDKIEYVTIPVFENTNLDYLDQIKQIGDHKMWQFFITDLKRKALEILSTTRDKNTENHIKSVFKGIKYVEDGITTRAKKYEELKNENV